MYDIKRRKIPHKTGILKVKLKKNNLQNKKSMTLSVIGFPFQNNPVIKTQNTLMGINIVEWKGKVKGYLLETELL